MQPLSRRSRRWFFVSFILIFSISVPIFAFYATGYRLDFSTPENRIVTVGGMYVSADIDSIEMFINDELVEDMRFFQSAAYIQNLPAGQHQIHTQGLGVYTWVKSLPIYPRIVTTADSFNVPVRPQIRLVPEWETQVGETVLFTQATSTKFAFASTTNPRFFVATTTATTTFSRNLEYDFLRQQFASSAEDKASLNATSTATTTPFVFSTQQPAQPVVDQPVLPSATSTVLGRSLRLDLIDEEVFATYIGSANNAPRNFCVRYQSATSTIAEYGEHVFVALQAEFATSTLQPTTGEPLELCRTRIRLDRKWQSVQDFDFLPGRADIVLMHLQDGVYAVEVDDRGWQNVQQLYPGYHLEMLVTGGQVFIKDDDYILEVLTEVATL